MLLFSSLLTSLGGISILPFSDSDFIKKKNLLKKICCFFRLSHLHSQKIVHRDVKTENMLLDNTRTVKIADFGVARVEASNPNDMTGETGTLGYMAPEVRYY